MPRFADWLCLNLNYLALVLPMCPVQCQPPASRVLGMFFMCLYVFSSVPLLFNLRQPIALPNLHHPTSLLLSWPQNALNMQSCPVLLHNFYQSSRNKVHLSKGAPSTSISIGHIDMPKHVKIPSQKKYDRTLQKLSTWALFFTAATWNCFKSMLPHASLQCLALRRIARPYNAIHVYLQMITTDCMCLFDTQNACQSSMPWPRIPAGRIRWGVSSPLVGKDGD